MRLFQPKTVYEMILPILVANFVVGMGIWPHKSRLKILSIVYSVVCLLVYGVLIQNSIPYLDMYYLSKTNDLGRITFKALFYANIFLTFSFIFTGWIKVKSIQIALARISACEKTVEQMGIHKNYRKLVCGQLKSFVFIMIIIIGFIFLNHMVIPEETPILSEILLLLALHYPIALLYVADSSFLHWVRYSILRFKQLNNLLQRMLTTTPDSPQHKRVLEMKDEWNKTFDTSAIQQSRRTKDNTETMRAVKHMHLELIKSIRKMNEAYGMQILLSMTTYFLCITSLLYDAYTTLWQDISKTELQNEMILVTCWVFFYTSKVFIINHTCALASNEAANTGDIICELYEPSTSKEFRAEIRDFTLQLIQNPLIFTACGFFNLDHAFIHGVIGSITTYLVILIQVGDISPITNSTMLHNVTDSTDSSV